MGQGEVLFMVMNKSEAGGHEPQNRQIYEDFNIDAYENKEGILRVLRWMAGEIDYRTE